MSAAGEHGLFAVIAGGQEVELPDYLALPHEQVPFHLGTMARVLGAVPVHSARGLLVTGQPAATPLDYIGAYVSLHDYLLPRQPLLDLESHRQLVVATALKSVGTRRMIAALVVLDRCLMNPAVMDPIETAFTAALSPDDRERLVNLRRPGPEQRGLLARQVILAALRLVLTSPEVDGPSEDPPFPQFAAILLCHAVAQKLSSKPATSKAKIGRFDAELATEMIRNGIFNSTDDAFAMIDRHLRLWRDYESEAAPLIAGRTPRELVRDAIGIQWEDFLAMGFALWLNTLEWNPEQPLYISEGAFDGVEPATRDAFLSRVAATPEELRDAFLPITDENWDMLAFQARPVLRCPEGLLVIDLILLLERVTEGLYWDVHDRQKGISEEARGLWTQAWGAAVEAMAEDDLRVLAPPVLGGRSFYTEEDLKRAYPKSQRADVVIDFGLAFMAAEVVSGQFSTPTRIGGDLESLRKDIDRLVMEKARQLDATAQNLVRNQKGLTGHDGPRRPVYPVVVVGGGISLNPVLASYINERIRSKGLFTVDSIEPLSLIDIGELEMLEGLVAARGCSPIDLLAQWHASGIEEMPLHNWLLATFDWDPDQYRPARMRPHVEATMAELLKHLGLPADDPAVESA